MSLPKKTLDTWSYLELVEEATAMLPSVAPEWTNYNAADPGITVLELLAYFTEILIFQTGQLTDADRIGFLKLLLGQDDVPALDGDPLKRALQSAVLQLRSVTRAVTAEDFETLSCRADPRVGRAICRPQVDLSENPAGTRRPQRPGHISVALLPAHGVEDAAMPEVLTAVRSLLEERRLITTRVHVVAAKRVSFTIRLRVSVEAGVPATTAAQEGGTALLRFLDPLSGGAEGKGWPMGRPVFVSDLYRVLTALPGVRHVLREVDSVTGREIEEIAAADGTLDRLQRNGRGELVAYMLGAEELPGKVDVLLTELPPTSDEAGGIFA